MLGADAPPDDTSLARYVLIDGLAHAIVTLEPHTMVTVERTLVFLSAGRFTLSASVEALDDAPAPFIEVCRRPLVLDL